MRDELVFIMVLGIGGLISHATPAGNLVPGGRLQPAETTPQPHPPVAGPTTPRDQSKVGVHHTAKPRPQHQPVQPEGVKDGSIQF